jgi:hypothetical protein
MDEVWLAALADKTYLFPAAWPLDAWILNLGYIAVIVTIYRLRPPSSPRRRA